MEWKPKDIIIMILASAVAILIVAIPIIRFVMNEPVNSEAAKIIGAILTAIIALIGVHIGSKK